MLCRRTFTQTQLPRAGGLAEAGSGEQPDCSVNLNLTTRRDKAGGDNKLVRTDRCAQRMETPLPLLRRLAIAQESCHCLLLVSALLGVHSGQEGT